MTTPDTRPTLSYDGRGINGPDDFRTRLATFTTQEAADKWGPMFAAAPDLLAALEETTKALAALIVTFHEEAPRCSRGYTMPALTALYDAREAIANAHGPA